MGKRKTKPENPVWLKPKTEIFCSSCNEKFLPSYVNVHMCPACRKDPAYSRWKNYGITPFEQKILLEQQDHKCAICGKNDPYDLDHCHESGKIRGFLCRQCNIRLAALDDREWFQKARKYLEDRL